MEKKWYKSRVMKAVLVIVAHVTAVVMAACTLWAASYPELFSEMLERSPSRKYEDSQRFNNQVLNNSLTIISGVGTKKIFETDGALDRDRIVDIEEYYEQFTISGENASGLSYSLGDLLDWFEEGNFGGDKNFYDYVDDNVELYVEESESSKEAQAPIVCKRSDGTYHYYDVYEFKELIKSGDLQFVVADDESGMSANQILEELESGNASSMDTFMGIQNAEGKMQYIDCWRYDGYLFEEKFQPIGAENVMDIVNENPYWNGRLNDAFNMIQMVVSNIGYLYKDYQTLNTGYDEGDTNYFYLYADIKNGRIFTNKKEYASYGDLEKSLDKIRSSGRYAIVAPKLVDFETNMNDIDAALWRNEMVNAGPQGEEFLFAAGVDTSYPIHDEFYSQSKIYDKYSSSMTWVVAVMVLSFAAFLTSIVWLIAVAGRNGEDQELHLCAFDRIKTEIAAGLVIGIWIIPILLSFGIFSISNLVDIALGAIVCLIVMYSCAMFLIGLLSLVRRIKARTVWKNSVLRSFCGFVKQILENLNNVWKTILVYGGFVLIHWLTILSCGWVQAIPVLIMLTVEVIAFVVVVRNAIGKYKIMKGIQIIAQGEVDYKIPAEELRGEQRKIAEAINSIGTGLDAAVERSMKSERLKTDLITNVSHDIKTPLTSIINYVDLLKKENFEDPKVQRYIEVLEAKAQRLKTLTEDVVEASKVSSGNITLEYMNINLVEMIQQTSGEFEEKFQARGLKEVLNLPEEEAVVRVDGRRTWRVLENIYNNAAKYAMEGTRVYADLKIENGYVSFSLKNVSEQPLNISADELTERFIRGDISRSTEGSGLGLSIAKTLAEMQGGKFELYLDGDLFKVTITFPRV